MDATTFADVGSFAAAPENPVNWLSLAKDVGSLFGNLGGLFGGGEYLAPTGQHTAGFFDASGFHGSTDTKNSGGTYDPQPPSQQEWVQGYLTKNLIDPYKQIFGSGNVRVPIDVTTSVASGEKGRLQGVGNAIVNFAKSMMDTNSTLPAPTVPDTTMPAGTPGVVSLGMSSGGGSTVAPAPAAKVAPPSMVAGVPNWALLAVAAYVAVHLWGKK